MRSKLPLLLALAAGLAPCFAALDPSTSFDWNALKPLRELEYHDCYEELKCARLLVPLDWKNASDQRTVALAVVKLPAVVPDWDPRFGGSVLSNPGGPGGSGVDLVRIRGKRLRSIVDTPGRRHHEIVSFDPRGMANSRPLADCFPGPSAGDVLARYVFDYERRGNGPLDGGPRALPYMLGLVDAFAQRCRQATAGGPDASHIFEFMSTPSVARDMVEIVDKLAELRAREAGGYPPDLKRRRAGTDDNDVARLQYLGFSYGTALGNYFASLFPERIGRMVLDGVLDATDYATGPGWVTNTVDADSIVASFYSGCHQAGPSVCALARASDASELDIRARVDTWLAAIDKSPIAGNLASGAMVAVTSRDYREILGRVIYTPIPGFRHFARVLDAAMAGDIAGFLALADSMNFTPHLNDACPVGNGTASPSQALIGFLEAFAGVACGDGDSVTGNDESWWRRYVAKQVDNSAVLGSFWATLRISCSAWPFRTNWSFKGPFTSPEPQPGTKGKPAAPLLFLSNRLDPVTPLRAARAMVAGHPHAGLVIQEGLGHCSLASANSSCTTRIVAEYFESGRVPPRETVCAIDCGPWDAACDLTGIADHDFTLGETFPLGTSPQRWY